jgi:GAF domain-containing protein
MLKRLQDFFIPASITDEKIRSEYRLLQVVLLIALVATTASLISDGIVGKKVFSIITLGGLSGLLVISAILLKFGFDRFARLIVPTSLQIGLSLLIWKGDGTHDVATIALAANIILVSLVIGPLATYIFAFLSSTAVLLIGIAEIQGIIVNKFSQNVLLTDLAIAATLYFLTAWLQNLLLGRLNAGLVQAQKNEEYQAKANAELRILHADLEARTIELERANKISAERTAELRTIAEISSSFTSLESLNELLPKITQRISEALDVYHAAIFLVDDTGEYAVLSATNSEGGKRMLERGNRLKVGQTGIVGYVSAFGKARIALDVGNDAVFFNNPDLPETHSELALPLKLQEKTIGVLDVQSVKQIAFTIEDIDTLSLLAGQIAITIQNAQLFEETQRALLEAQTIYGQSARSSWREFASRGIMGFSYEKGIVSALQQPAESAAAGKTSKKAPVNKNAGEAESLSIPIKVRGEELGVLNVRQPGRSSDWSESEIRLYQAIVERLSFALENARLIEETTKNAERDRTITEIADRLGSAPMVEEILRTAAEELSRALKGSEVLVQLQSVISNDSQV